MNVRALLIASVIGLAACQNGDVTSPPKVLAPSGALPAISDGANGGNPDFWFLSPMVANPNGNPLYNDNGFNANLLPRVKVTDLSNNAVVFQPTTASLNGNHYALNWNVPAGLGKTYRVEVLVGTTPLGFADVKTAKNGSTPGFITTNDNKTLAVKFIIENFALCDVPGTGPCSSETINLRTTSEVNLNLPGYGNSGLTVPPQDEGGTTTITVEPCDAENPGFTDMNPAVTDLPTYGPCMVVEANPPLSEVDPNGLLDNPAVVFVCDITPDLAALSAEQRERVTLHKYDPGTLKALPHAPHACETTVGARSMKGFFANVFSGSFKNAGRQLASLFTARPLYAAVMLDVGAGGLTLDFSAFQFALPSKLTIVEGDDQVAAPGSTLPTDPKVILTDVGGDPVEGATVRFVGTLSACGTPALTDVVSDANGHASKSWTISGTPGPNTLYACGRGLAGDDNNGPRADVVDPFQPLSDHFGDASEGPEVLVETGSVEFNATGTFPGDPLPVNYGSSGWSYQIDGSPTAGWESSSTSPFVLTGAAPFGSPGSCPLNSAGVATAWPTAASTFLYARRTVALSADGRLEIKVAIDNDIQVFVDGVDISAGLQLDGDCPILDERTFVSGELTAGPHIVAVRARDRGVSSYFDARISYLPPLVVLRQRRTP